MRLSPFLALLVLACGPKDAPVPAESPAAEPDPFQASVLAAMDATADPCNDFYQYACGGWNASTEIPSDRSRWARSFSVIAEANLGAQREILESASESDDAATAKVGAFYDACMAMGTVDHESLRSLAGLRDGIYAIEDATGLATEMGKLERYGISGLFSSYVYADLVDPDLNILHVGQGGLTLPDRDYYLIEEGDEDGASLVADYQAHIAKMFEMAGWEAERSAEAAARIVAFETALAGIQRPRAELRVVEENYHKIDRAGWQEQWGFPLDAYFTALGNPDATDVDVGRPDYFVALDGLMDETDLDTLKDYLWWRSLHELAPHVSAGFDEENFAFFGTRLTGQPEQSARWKQCVELSDQWMGDAVGQAFVDANFPGDSKTIAQELVRRVEASFEANLPELAWMDDATREVARVKAGSIVNKIGYPDKWKDYTTLEVDAADHLGNIVRARQFVVDDFIGRIGNPVDEDEWFMTPPTVNAYYNPSANEIVFPAGILQSPFFGRNQPMSMNYGAIGMVIGHEITHGFDDEGRKFDAEGRMNEWWAPEVAERFEEQAACLVEAYDGFELREGLSVNGSLTLGENIADHGGIKSAYQAYKAWEAENGAEDGFGGLTPDQLFFLGFAQGWCQVARPEIEEMLITTDPHSPARFRVNGPAMHSVEFANAFQCEAGDAMVAEERCEVW